MLTPYVLGLLGFYVVPFAISVVYTFMSGTGFSGRFVGLTNYKSVFASDAFRLAVGNTFRFLIVSIPLIMIISFLLANLLFKAFRGFKLFRSIFLFPLVIPIGSIVMFVNVFLTERGILNSLLAKIGIQIGESWMNSGRAFWVLVFLYVWKNFGYNMILFLAGFNYIPKEMYENAEVVGANRRQIMRYVTLPMMKNSFFFVFIVSIANVFKSFREAYMLGGIYPDESIYMLQHFMTNNFANLNYQRLSIASFAVFLVIFTLIFFLYRSWNKNGVEL